MKLCISLLVGLLALPCGAEDLPVVPATQTINHVTMGDSGRVVRVHPGSRVPVEGLLLRQDAALDIAQDLKECHTERDTLRANLDTTPSWVKVAVGAGLVVLGAGAGFAAAKAIK